MRIIKRIAKIFGDQIMSSLAPLRAAVDRNTTAVNANTEAVNTAIAFIQAGGIPQSDIDAIAATVDQNTASTEASVSALNAAVSAARTP